MNFKIPFSLPSKSSSTSEPELPTSETEVLTSEPELPTSEAKVSTSEAEVLTSDAEVPTSEAEVPTSEGEIPTSEAEMAALQPLASLHENAKFLQDLATRIWRAQKQLDKALQNTDDAQLERFARRFEEISETLNDYGIEILDHTGQNYDVGLNLTVLQFEPTPGIAREVISETIKPSLRMHGVLVPGQVVVAAPSGAGENL